MNTQQAQQSRKNPLVKQVSKLFAKIAKSIHDRKKARTIQQYRNKVNAIKKTKSVNIIEFVEAAEPGSMKLVRVAKDANTKAVLVRATSTKVITVRARSNDIVEAPKEFRGLVRSRILDATVPNGSISPRN